MEKKKNALKFWFNLFAGEICQKMVSHNVNYLYWKWTILTDNSTSTMQGVFFNNTTTVCYFKALESFIIFT